MGLFGIFGKKEAGNVTEPKNDTERWLVGTYAMWSVYAEGDWRYFAGSKEKSKPEGASMRVMLRRDWEVNNKATLLDMVSSLTVASGAWELCRACQILAMGFVGGYIEREEMVQRSIEIGRVMQRHYHSWTELYDSYLKGYKDWRSEQGGDAGKDIAAREELCYQLRNQLDGPCSVEWDLELGRA